MFFDPSAPIAFSLSILAVATIFIAFANKNWRFVLALSLGLVGARLLTDNQDTMHTHVMFVCACISIWTFKLGGFKSNKWLINLEENEVNYVVAFLYVLRMIVGILAMFKLYPVWIMWDISNAILLLQLLLIIGDSIDAYSRRINDWISHSRISSHKYFASFW